MIHSLSLTVKNIAQPALGILTSYFAEHPELKLKNNEATTRIFVGTLIHRVLTQKMLHNQALIPINEDRLIASLIDLIVD